MDGSSKPSFNIPNCVDDGKTKIQDLVIRQKGLDFIKTIHEGRFSSVIAVKYPNQKSELALKVISEDKISKNELDWQDMDHPHILKLLEFDYLQDLKKMLFVTEIYNCRIQDKIMQNSFKKSKDAVKMIVYWIKQAAMGISYIHERNLCHLNVTGRNIIITQDGTAKLKHFSFLQPADNEVGRLGIPMQFLPPEIFSMYVNANGQKLDVWSLSITMLNLLTGSRLENQFPENIDSWHLVYHILFKTLKFKSFKKLVGESFPASRKEKDLKNIRNCIRSCLTFFPEFRPTAEEQVGMLRRLIYCRGGKIPFPKDKIWQKEADWEVIEKDLDPNYSEKKEFR